MRKGSKKKISGFALALLMTVACAGCKDPAASTPSTTPEAEQTEAISTTAEDTTKQTEPLSEATTTEPTNTPTEPVTEPVEVSKRPVNNEDTLEYQDIYFADFEDGTIDFTGRSSEILCIVSEDAYNGEKCLQTSNRTATWNGPQIDVSERITSGQKYYVKTYVKYVGGSLKSQNLYLKMDYNEGTSYMSVTSKKCNAGEWTLLEGYMDMPADTKSARFYLETDYSAAGSEDYLVDIYLDDFYIQGIYAKSNAAQLPSLYKEHEEHFKTGVAVLNADILNPDKAAVILQHFNSMTMGNELKPDSILDYEACSADPEKYNLSPAVHFENADVGVKFAQENGIPLRGHTLVWHSQTPRWFFTENYSKDADAKLVSKEVMLQRMENYIRQVLEHFQTEYPGVIYCWDVVNEAIVPGDSPNGFRSKDSLWYQVIGEEFVEMAFTYARKYADPDVKLFYNDFNSFESLKSAKICNMLKPLVEKGLVDGMGMQSHIQMDYPTLFDYKVAIQRYAALGIEIQITELDISQSSNTKEAQLRLAKRYKQMMQLFYEMDDLEGVDITAVTVWGLTDDTSWLNGDTNQYPLLFNAYLQAKEAFWGFFLDSSVAD